MDWLSDPAVWVGLLTLVSLEIVLGVDNVVFISIISSKLPADQQERARRMGIGAAVISRILLLLSISWVIRLESTLFTVLDQKISGKDLILIVGGLFLLAKATHEIHAKLEGEHEAVKSKGGPSFAGVIFQIMLLDIIFSLDSVITAVGMVEHIAVMVVAVLIAAGVMFTSAGPISNFVHRHPTFKMLALSFLILIGVTLVAEGFEQHISKGYIYFAMGFSLVVEVLNMRVRKPAAHPVELREPTAQEAGLVGAGH